MVSRDAPGAEVEIEAIQTGSLVFFPILTYLKKERKFPEKSKVSLPSVWPDVGSE